MSTVDSQRLALQPEESRALASQAAAQAAARPNETHLIWLDMEMSGLRPEVDRILEVAVIITDTDLNPLAESEAIAIRQPEELLDGMDAWNKGTHGRSGLIERVRHSMHSERDAELYLLGFLAAWVPSGKSPMCGNSIGQDRRFMARYMPELERYFHYRNLDVSTLKELCKRWRPDLIKGFDKRSAHTALADIRESIEELQYYKTHFLRHER
ncbi:MAG: oligoribonuclease [Betaproteobacteria bacterium]|nr:oligoribonuclease [Betaproteobacteria bacterium]